ncbi:hypothetical protein IscW_ISCW022322 [Ixodes scapularis]|uniref:Uncharacterized protein n=1 Tax=Ixodes scapularis TaxID=6945 RepID=B7QDW2_IXOSC|nr:hypothetical protein IscW_ISCW022322 [Ixodes scapularis]|eukprot:XP_002413726.1 hypothetical protein IscW_ISCW022322 [Ixodes scapularis]
MFARGSSVAASGATWASVVVGALVLVAAPNSNRFPAWVVASLLAFLGNSHSARDTAAAREDVSAQSVKEAALAVVIAERGKPAHVTSLSLPLMLVLVPPGVVEVPPAATWLNVGATLAAWRL